jgi:hypothetical protein
MKKPHFYNLLDQIRSDIQAMKDSKKYDVNRRLINKLTKKQDQMLEDYTMIEYDLLIGKQYSKDLLYPK